MSNNALLSDNKKKVEIIIKTLKKLFPTAKTVLNYSNNFQLLTVVVLSAQCTDNMVNKVTKELFKKYKKVEDFAKADIQRFEKEIKSTGFYRNKAKNIINSAKIIVRDYKGNVPNSMSELLKLPGIARKSANIILYLAHRKIAGIAVDTHVIRLSKVLGLSQNTNPEKIEKDLMEILPKKEWMDFNFRLVDYGRKYCMAKKHDHGNCPLTPLIS
ncbi:MAG: endonuclease III [bacterium]